MLLDTTADAAEKGKDYARKQWSKQVQKGRMTTEAMEAPASARARAIPWPIPVLPPVTRATLPVRLNGLAMLITQLRDGMRVPSECAGPLTGISGRW